MPNSTDYELNCHWTGRDWDFFLPIPRIVDLRSIPVEFAFLSLFFPFCGIVYFFLYLYFPSFDFWFFFLRLLSLFMFLCRFYQRFFIVGYCFVCDGFRWQIRCWQHRPVISISFYVYYYDFFYLFRFFCVDIVYSFPFSCGGGDGVGREGGGGSLCVLPASLLPPLPPHPLHIEMGNADAGWFCRGDGAINQLDSVRLSVGIWINFFVLEMLVTFEGRGYMGRGKSFNEENSDFHHLW